MPQFFFNKRLIVLLVSIIILVALIGFSLNGRKTITWPEQFVKDTVGLVQSTAHKPAQYVADFFGSIEDLKNTYEENKVLKKNLDKYMQLEADVKDLERKNKELNERLDKDSTLRDYDPINATVIARSPDRWNEAISIDRGKVHGVENDMAVMTSSGLIGRVVDASQFTSTVQLLSSQDRTNRASVTIQGSKNVNGLISGYDQKREALILTGIPHSAKIKEKQKVITSGYSGVFPQGRIVGEISDIESDNYGLTKTAYVKPAADFKDIQDVTVLKRVEPSPQKSLDEGEEK